MIKSNIKDSLRRINKINKFLIKYTNKKLLIVYFFISLFSGFTEIASIGFLFSSWIAQH